MSEEKRKSLYFYTFHKCASALFGNYVLGNLTGLVHRDYAGEIYSGNRPRWRPVRFKRNGMVYGPIRLTADFSDPVGRRFVSKAAQTTFVRDKCAIFLVRDPRDILVSLYYSFGFTHRYSPVASIRKKQIRLRERIQQLGMDAYALEEAEKLAERFRLLKRLADHASQSVVLRYEDMILDFERFATDFRRVLPESDGLLAEVYKRTRPREEEDIRSHHRSGEPGGFRTKFSPETITQLNATFADIGKDFEYSI